MLSDGVRQAGELLRVEGPARLLRVGIDEIYPKLTGRNLQPVGRRLRLHGSQGGRARRRPRKQRSQTLSQCISAVAHQSTPSPGESSGLAPLVSCDATRPRISSARAR